MDTNPISAKFQPGTEIPSGIGRYVLLRKLNTGGTSVVIEAVDRTSPQKNSVAIKIIDLNHADQRLRTRLETEIRIGTNISHPFIVRVLDFFLEGHFLCIVEEYVKGWDLLDVLNRKPGGCLDEAAARRMFVQLLEGVRYLHECGISHRDLKPENVMVEAATGNIKIIDLGLSKLIASARTLGIGTPGYIAPELILRGDPHQDHPVGDYDPAKADVFSLGCTLYLTLCGYHCFEDPANPRDVTSMLKNQIRGLCRPLPPGLTRSPVARLLQRMLVPDPRKRANLDEVSQHEWVRMQPGGGLTIGAGGGMSDYAAGVGAGPVGAPAGPMGHSYGFQGGKSPGAAPEGYHVQQSPPMQAAARVGHGGPAAGGASPMQLSPSPDAYGRGYPGPMGMDLMAGGGGMPLSSRR